MYRADPDGAAVYNGPGAGLHFSQARPGTSGPPRPQWLRAPAPGGENYRDLKELIGRLRLHTVCESAACPNVGECWNHRTATFMILGNVCTRRCGFCAVEKGAPLPVDYDEPQRVAAAVEAMGLKFAVITSVNRDDRAGRRRGTVRPDHPRHPRARSRLRHRGADAGLSGQARGRRDGDGSRAGRVQPQHRNRAEAVPPGAAGRALRALARRAGSRQARGARHADEIRPDAGPGRDHGGGARGDARPARARRRAS